jgi:hypothetical protein
LLLVLSCWVPALAEKSDVVVFDTGTRMIGEVKALERGKLRFKTEATDTIEIEWEHVDTVTTGQTLEVELQRGLIFYGSLEAAAQPGMIKVVGPAATTELDMNRVVRITPIKATFWKRLDGSFSLGFSYTKASDIAQFSFNGDAKYRRRKEIPLVRQLSAKICPCDTTAISATVSSPSPRAASIATPNWVSICEAASLGAGDVS